jgi:hypothetical protein
MITTSFITYFRCNCGRLMTGVTGAVTICMVCMADHHFDRGGRFTIGPGPRACAAAIEMDLVEGASPPGWKCYCPQCRRPVSAVELVRLGVARRRWNHELDCSPPPCRGCGYRLSWSELRTIYTCPGCDRLFDRAA